MKMRTENSWAMEVLKWVSLLNRAEGTYLAYKCSASLFVKFFTISAWTLASDCGAIRYIVLIYQKILTISSSTPKSATFSK